jgi:hypothetical protein
LGEFQQTHLVTLPTRHGTRKWGIKRQWPHLRGRPEVFAEEGIRELIAITKLKKKKLGVGATLVPRFEQIKATFLKHILFLNNHTNIAH